MRTKSLVFLVVSIIFIMLYTITCSAQQNASQQVYDAINARRTEINLPPLVYRIGKQLSVEERVTEISFKFELSQDCDCDFESIGGDYSLQALVSKMTNIDRYKWLHFEPEARFTAIAVIEKNGIYYCVVRTYAN